MKTIVAKFGGTSLADADQFRKVKEIVLQDPARRFVVASAPGKRFPEDVKVTDLLIEAYERAVSGRDFLPVLSEIRSRFTDIADALQVDAELSDEFEVLKIHLQSEPDREYVASRGEHLCAHILADYLGFTFVDPAWCVCFNEDGTLNMKMTMRTMKAALLPQERAVVAGYYGGDVNDKIHTFSRGGSDVTGSLIALAMEADLYENWTDVPGLLAADPHIVPHPKSVRYITGRELRTLSYMGASVLHSDAVLPASTANIPINIRNTNVPEDPGTMIYTTLPRTVTRSPITGVAGRKGMSVIQVEKVMVSDGAGFSAMMLDMLKARNIPFEQCLTGIDTITLVMQSAVLQSCKEDLVSEIQTVLKPDFLGVKENLSMIAVVGERGTEATDANIRVLQSLSAEGIEISTINQGAGKLNLLIGVPEARYEDAIRAIYHTMEEDQTK